MADPNAYIEKSIFPNNHDHPSVELWPWMIRDFVLDKLELVDFSELGVFNYGYSMQDAVPTVTITVEDESYDIQPTEKTRSADSPERLEGGQIPADEGSQVEEVFFANQIAEYADAFEPLRPLPTQKRKQCKQCSRHRYGGGDITEYFRMPKSGCNPMRSRQAEKPSRRVNSN